MPEVFGRRRCYISSGEVLEGKNMVENGGGEEEEKEVLKGEKLNGLECRREREYEIQTQHVDGSSLHDGVYLLPVLIPRPVEFAR
ncbi:hypothetical protein KQX54_009758 [Cotesia glomerata]|uniref:Uncharacterized protein n=1 Tax=Cotesia glomerata TaxID=32391 RepID=A0AAV7IIR0_COTGL|nr:hypothetical protein KQX54_009758 [Cotesia glomerata]